MPYIVALSGGIASGKSTVASLFAKLGAAIIDADIIARQVVKSGTRSFKQIVAHFGEQILLPSGDLNRTKLRKIIFNNDNERIWLNQHLHPIIEQETKKQIQQIDAPYVIWVVPLLIENHLQDQADRILIIDTSTDIQIERLQQRDNIDQALARNMLLSQVSNQKRLSYADDIISNNARTNNCQPSDLIAQVASLHNKYLELAQTLRLKIDTTKLI